MVGDSLADRTIITDESEFYHMSVICTVLSVKLSTPVITFNKSTQRAHASAKEHKK